MDVDKDYSWPAFEPGHPRMCPARIDSNQGALTCDQWANHEHGHTFTATSQPQDADHDTEARQEAQP